MAKIIRRTWTTKGPTGKKVRHTAFGYHLMVEGKREKKFSSEWATEADALAALAARQKEIAAGIMTRPADRTLAEVAEEYLAYKRSHGKRTVAEDARVLRVNLLP